MRLALLFAAALFGCSSKSAPPTAAPFDGGDFGCVPKDPVPPLDGAVGGRCNCNSLAKTTNVAGGKCSATVKQWAYEGGEHQTPGTKIVYCSKPPNSGPHYFVWAAFKNYDQPVDPGYLVHSMEHGAVVLWYKCANAAACPDIAKQLTDFAAARPDDPACAGEVPKHRIIVVPDPTLETKFAASAHQWTYTADCFDQDSLGKFVDAHYAHGPENFCSDGTDPTTIEADSGVTADAATDASTD